MPEHTLPLADFSYPIGFAKHLVENVYKVKQDDWVLIEFCLFGPGEFPLIYHIIDEAAKKGAHATAVVRDSNALSYRVGKDVPDKFLKTPNKYEKFKFKKCNYLIQFLTKDNKGLLGERPPDNITKNAPVMTMQRKKMNRKTCPKALVGYPYEALAKDAEKYFGISYSEFIKIYDKAFATTMNLPLKQMEDYGSKIEGVEKLHLTGDGIDITMDTRKRKAKIDKGITDVKNKLYLTNIPDGEVCIAPLENSVNGYCTFDINLFQGVLLKNLRLEFKDGKLVKWSAEEGEETFTKFVKARDEPFKIFAEFGTGFVGDTMVGDMRLDEKLKGTIHMAIGLNNQLGGKNISTDHEDFLCKILERNGKLYADDKLVTDFKF